MPELPDIRAVGIPDWDIEQTAKPLGVTYKALAVDLQDGRTANPIFSLWLSQHGYHRLADGKSGYFLFRDQMAFRLRVAGATVEFSPSINRGAFRVASKLNLVNELSKLSGFVLAFGSQMPYAVYYELSVDFVEFLQKQGILSGKFSCPSKRMRELVEEETKTQREALQRANSFTAPRMRYLPNLDSALGRTPRVAA